MSTYSFHIPSFRRLWLGPAVSVGNSYRLNYLEGVLWPSPLFSADRCLIGPMFPVSQPGARACQCLRALPFALRADWHPQTSAGIYRCKLKVYYTYFSPWLTCAAAVKTNERPPPVQIWCLLTQAITLSTLKMFYKIWLLFLSICA